MEITSQMKAVATVYKKAYGERLPVHKYYDDSDASSIFIATMEDFPQEGIVSRATIGLLNYDIGLNVESKALRVEFIGAAYRGSDELLLDILCTCAFNIINSNYKCFPGVVYPDVVKMYCPDYQVQHILLTSPFLWEGSLQTQEFEDKKVTWLQAIPITENELVYLEKNGAEALENLLEEKEADVLDLTRHSIL